MEKLWYDQLNLTVQLPDFAIRGHPTEMRMPGVEPGSQAWEACMMPLHYMRHVRVSDSDGARAARRTEDEDMRAIPHVATNFETLLHSKWSAV